ncbi:phenylacetic acid degradation operon negative regulatory protein [Paenarthrobacter nicotinovorans]|uniref:PaaX family transcriptional regulator n=1 Tax=Paenarthrobacter nicotinovorans TaxID=29320 RepID=UPI00277FDE50|nr:PaaX family transcriptional regulator C-terminal domain-containing protein [Paenarthrobacter nicotinovorans]MDP9936899.1 phenylacetic acid degradation operon negative regulatory protein [Paenarthrobacter nicotinovorans]
MSAIAGTEGCQSRTIEVPAPVIRQQGVIVTLYGLYSREPGSALPVAALVALLTDLGYDAPGVRSAISRLKSKGVLHSVRVGNAAAYELSASLQSIFAEGDQRIFTDRRSDGAHDWVLALFSVPEAQRHLRHQLRSLLANLGFGTVAAGVWIASASVIDRTRDLLVKQGLDEFVEFFRGDYLFGGDVKVKVAEWWDLDAVDALMGEFLEHYQDADQIWTGYVGSDPAEALSKATPEVCRDAFRFYIPMLTLWRRLPYRDPNLPLDYLPEGWKEPLARRAFVHTHRLIAPLAAQHAKSVISGFA